MWNMVRPGAAGPCPLDGAPNSTCHTVSAAQSGLNPVDIPPARPPKSVGTLSLYAVVFNGQTSMMWLNEHDAALIGVEVPGT